MRDGNSIFWNGFPEKCSTWNISSSCLQLDDFMTIRKPKKAGAEDAFRGAGSKLRPKRGPKVPMDFRWDGLGGPLRIYSGASSAVLPFFTHGIRRFSIGGRFMGFPRLAFQALAVLAAMAMALGLAPGALAAGKKEVLYSFKGGDDGKYPTYPGLVFDKAGNLYGMTFDGGKYGLGTVFELKPNKDGSWTETVIHTFAGNLDGADPFSGLVIDSAGNLYGTTYFGGGLGSCSDGGCGTVFRLSPGRNGEWSETILRSFDNGIYGGNLSVSLILDASGNLYGAAEGGNRCQQDSCGVVFELVRAARAPRREKLLYSFHGGDGWFPQSPLIFDANGNLFGTTYGGGPDNAGVVFELQPAKRGLWEETVLQAFTHVTQGFGPSGLLALDARGNLYGSTQNGGKYPCDGPGCGVIYELAHGSWQETIIHEFRGRDFKGMSDPTSGVAFDSSGNLYGAATGTALYPGGIFQLTPRQGGTWKETLISKFPVDVSPGMVVYGLDGDRYGVSYGGGKYNLGAVFRIKP